MDVVRRARISAGQKLRTLAFGSYANADGTGIFCGGARLAADCGVCYDTASRHIRWMRDVGFAALVQRGNHRRGKADSYRLTLADGLLDRVEIPDPDQYRKIIGEIAEQKRAETKKQQARSRARARLMDADSVHKNPVDSTGLMDASASHEHQSAHGRSVDAQVSTETGFTGHHGPAFMDALDVAPPLIDHLTRPTDLPWQTADRRNEREGVARAGAVDEREISAMEIRTGPCNRCGARLGAEGYCLACLMKEM